MNTTHSPVDPTWPAPTPGGARPPYISNRKAWAIIAVAGVVVLGALAVIEAVNPDPKTSGLGDAFYVNEDEGWAAVYGVDAGWSCRSTGQAMTCGGGTGPLRVAPGTKGKIGMLGEWDGGMLFRYDVATWSCAKQATRVTCAVR